MPRRPAGTRFGLPCLVCLLAPLATAPAAADFLVDLTGTAQLQADGTYLYQYTLANRLTSDAPVQSWLLDFAAQIGAGGFAQPAEWSSSYVAGTPGVLWRCDSPFDVDPAFVIEPGKSRTFSFTSPAVPGSVAYSVTGLSYEGDDPTLQGMIVGPVVPEPAATTAVLLAASACLLLRRRLAAPPRP